MLDISDSAAERIKSKYHINDAEIQELISSKKIDVQWMEPIIKVRP